MGVLYSLRLENENQVKCDISPFPGLSPYSLEESCQAFEEKLLDCPLLTYNVEEISPNPHVQFALFQIWSSQQKDSAKLPIKVNELRVKGSLNKELPEKGVIKYKIDPAMDLSELVTFLKSSRNLLLRLDGNTLFTLDEFNNFLENLRGMGVSEEDFKKVDYFEEPLKSFSDYHHLNSSMPVAHEEHAKEFLLACAKKEAPKNSIGLVIKPSQVGLAPISFLKKYGMRVILSSAFEVPCALRALKTLAKEFPDETHGLGAFLNYP